MLLRPIVAAAILLFVITPVQSQSNDAYMHALPKWATHVVNEVINDIAETLPPAEAAIARTVSLRIVPVWKPIARNENAGGNMTIVVSTGMLAAIDMVNEAFVTALGTADLAIRAHSLREDDDEGRARLLQENHKRILAAQANPAPIFKFFDYVTYVATLQEGKTLSRYSDWAGVTGSREAQNAAKLWELKGWPAHDHENYYGALRYSALEFIVAHEVRHATQRHWERSSKVCRSKENEQACLGLSRQFEDDADAFALAYSLGDSGADPAGVVAPYTLFMIAHHKAPQLKLGHQDPWCRLSAMATAYAAARGQKQTLAIMNDMKKSLGNCGPK